jgi:hypothetical protein
VTHNIAAHRDELVDGETSLRGVDKVLDHPEVRDLMCSASRDWLLMIKRCRLGSLQAVGESAAIVLAFDELLDLGRSNGSFGLHGLVSFSVVVP